MSAQLGAGMRFHAAANSHGQMIAARKRPDIAFEVGEKFYGDRVGGSRNEIALGHFSFVALQGAGFGDKLISGASGKHQKIGAAPFAGHAEARLGTSRVDVEN